MILAPCKQTRMDGLVLREKVVERFRVLAAGVIWAYVKAVSQNCATITAKLPPKFSTVSRAWNKTHLAGFERKRSRSLLLMDHGRLGECSRFEKALLCHNVLQEQGVEYYEMVNVGVT